MNCGNVLRLFLSRKKKCRQQAAFSTHGSGRNPLQMPERMPRAMLPAEYGEKLAWMPNGKLWTTPCSSSDELSIGRVAAPGVE